MQTHALTDNIYLHGRSVLKDITTGGGNVALGYKAGAAQVDHG